MIEPRVNCNYYMTKSGICLHSSCEYAIEHYIAPNYKGKIQLVLTSPPFPLKRAKKYGNKTGQDYLDWLCGIGNTILPLLTENGSIVIEIGNAWNPGEPTYSTLPVETLIEFKKQCNLYLCQEFVYYNPARLPGPIEWVNKKRIRVKDSFTHIWWLSKSTNPYADNREIKEMYSKQMQKLLASGKYNSGIRPSEHNISETAFSVDNGGAIPSNVIIASNTASKDSYLDGCRNHGLEIHPARMASAIPEFFIKFLTKKDDIVFDCFSGSNTTGSVAEKLHRFWIASELNEQYYKGSQFRFDEVMISDERQE